MSKNDITGDDIKTKVASKEYEDNFDRIFRNKSKADKSVESCPSYPTACFCTGACQEQRLKAIAQNGNTVDHYGDVYDKVERDYEPK